MDIAEVLKEHENAQGADLSLLVENAPDSENFDFYLVVSSDKAKDRRYALEREVEKLKLSDGSSPGAEVLDSKNYRSLLMIGDELFPNKKKYHFALCIDLDNQFRMLMEYIGMDMGGKHRPRSSMMLSVYAQISEAAAKLAENGCKLTFSMDAGKAAQLTRINYLLQEEQ